MPCRAPRSGLCVLASAVTVALTLGLPPPPARAQDAGSRCTAGAADIVALIACVKEALKEQRQACTPTEAGSWSPPVEGRRILDYGDKTQYGATSRGIVIEAKGGAVVRPPAAGVVLHAGEFRSYGKLVIVDACSVDVLLAGLDAVAVRPGTAVQPSTDLGTMAAGEQGGAPVLYFEVRDEGRPIDPNPFLGSKLQ